MVNCFAIRIHSLQALKRVVAMGTICCLLAPATGMAMTPPFSATQQVSSDDLSAFTKWTSLLPRYETEWDNIDQNCAQAAANPERPPAPCQDKEWEALLEKLDGKSEKKQLQAVNDFFNKITYINDIDNYGVDDYWATPHEFMQRGGDCEDYAIAKYISLKRLGIDEDDMRIMIVSDTNLNGQMHAILEVTIDDVAYILDNQADQVIAAREIYHYQPIYAINENEWWAYIG